MAAAVLKLWPLRAAWELLRELWELWELGALGISGQRWVGVVWN